MSNFYAAVFRLILSVTRFNILLCRVVIQALVLLRYGLQAKSSPVTVTDLRGAGGESTSNENSVLRSANNVRKK
jgi:hypothetical protein